MRYHHHHYLIRRRDEQGGVFQSARCITPAPTRDGASHRVHGVALATHSPWFAPAHGGLLPHSLCCLLCLHTYCQKFTWLLPMNWSLKIVKTPPTDPSRSSRWVITRLQCHFRSSFNLGIIFVVSFEAAKLSMWLIVNTITERHHQTMDRKHKLWITNRHH